jgi:hypothetical protein
MVLMHYTSYYPSAEKYQGFTNIPIAQLQLQLL